MPAFTWENTLWCVSRERVSIRPFYTAIFNASKGLFLDSPGTHARLFASFWPSCNDAPAPSLERPRRLFGQHSTDASEDTSTSDEKVWQTTAVTKPGPVQAIGNILCALPCWRETRVEK